MLVVFSERRRSWEKYISEEARAQALARKGVSLLALGMQAL